MTYLKGLERVLPLVLESFEVRHPLEREETGSSCRPLGVA
jgi:hypothetical protein